MITEENKEALIGLFADAYSDIQYYIANNPSTNKIDVSAIDWDVVEDHLKQIGCLELINGE